LARLEKEFALDDAWLRADVQRIGQAGKPVGRLGRVEDLLALQFDAADDGGRGRVLVCLGGEPGREAERDGGEGKAARQ
jgi:hypothetical protein